MIQKLCLVKPYKAHSGMAGMPAHTQLYKLHNRLQHCPEQYSARCCRLTCRWTQVQVYDIARVQSDKSLRRGQASTTCPDHAGELRPSDHLQVGL